MQLLAALLLSFAPTPKVECVEVGYGEVRCFYYRKYYCPQKGQYTKTEECLYKGNTINCVEYSDKDIACIWRSKKT
jgi:hypothetical protein